MKSYQKIALGICGVNIIIIAILLFVKTIGKAMGTHKNKKKKKKVEEIIGNKRSRVGTNRR